MLTDYHVHLRPDEPGTTAEKYFTVDNAERFRLMAQEQGISELGVSEHIHRFAQALEIWDHPYWQRCALDDVDAYCNFVREQTDLKLGIEADFIFGREDRIAAFLEQRDWDYVLGSVHFLQEYSVDQEEWDVWDKDASPDKVWQRYFQTLAEAATSGLFDIMSHPDLIKVWGANRPQPEGDLRRYYEPAIEAIVDSGVAIEVSTAGLRKPIGEIYPTRQFLELCVEANVPIALSSDAHLPNHIGYGYEQALVLFEEVGVREICVFEKRERRLVSVAAE